MKLRNIAHYALIVIAAAFASPAPAQPKAPKTEIITHAYLADGELLTISSDLETLAKCNGKIAGNILHEWGLEHLVTWDTWPLDPILEAIHFSSDGSYLAAWNNPEACDYSVDGAIRLLDMDRWEDGSRAVCVGTIGGPYARVTCVTFSPDNKYLAACYDRAPRRDGGPKLWKPIRVFEVSTFNEIAWFTVPGTATNVQFSPDIKWIGAVSTEADNREFILWDFSERRKKFTVPVSLIHDFRFTTDSATIVFANADVTSPTALSVSKSSPTFQPYDVAKALDLFQPGFTVTSSDSEMILHHRKRDVTITVPVPPEGSDPFARRLTRSADGEIALVGSTLIEFKTEKVRTMDSKRGFPPPPIPSILHPVKQ